MAKCLSYDEVVAIHFDAMTRIWHERFFGIRDEGLLRSALARPEQAATYEEADLPTQAAYLFHDLLKNHPFHLGNKRTAFYCLAVFLQDNGADLSATNEEVAELAFSTEDRGWDVGTIASWIRSHLASY